MSGQTSPDGLPYPGPAAPPAGDAQLRALADAAQAAFLGRGVVDVDPAQLLAGVDDPLAPWRVHAGRTFARAGANAMTSLPTGMGKALAFFYAHAVINPAGSPVYGMLHADGLTVAGVNVIWVTGSDAWLTNADLAIVYIAIGK